MSDTTIVNAKITEADIHFSRGFLLDCTVTLETDGGGVGFGGWVLGGNPFDNNSATSRHGEQKNLAAEFIGSVMAVADAEKFSDLPGRVIRAEFEGAGRAGSKIIAIGHPIKDHWFNPEKAFKKITGKTA